ncbi:hypothetical protein ACP70R_047158 [Stipagrostis hirtigluma subsp. patula]
MGAKLSAVAADAVRAEMFPADAFAPARILRRLCVSIAAAISTAMEPAAEASVPWLQTAGKLLSALSGWLATASDTVLHKIPAAAIRVAQSIVGAWKPWLATALEFLTADLGPLVKARAADMGRLLAAALERARHVRRVLAASPSMASRFLLDRRVVAASALLALAVVAALFPGGASTAVALLLRTMKAPGLAGVRIPRLLFEASPRIYFATVRAARPLLRAATAVPKPVLLAGAVVAAFLLVSWLRY